MGGFVSSIDAARRHDVFAIERTPRAVIRANAGRKVWLVGQFPWGPDGVVFEPAGPGDRTDTIAPDGAPRTGSGYLATIRKAFAQLRLARVTGTDAEKATSDLDGKVTVEAKYVGDLGNELVATVEAASDGDSNHFNLTVTLTGDTGTTVDRFVNLNYSGTGDDSVPTFSDKKLVGAITKTSAGRPGDDDYTFSTGDDGTIDAAAYETALDLVGNQKGPGVVITDDPGDTIRAAVNAAVVEQTELKKDRMCVVNGDSGMTLEEANADVENYRGATVIYVDVWPYINDEASNRTLVPPNSFMASVLSQTSPSTSPAWKDPEVQAMLIGIVGTEAERGDGAATNTDNGIVTLITEELGGHTFEAGVVTIAPQDPRRRSITRTAMGQYMASAVTSSLRPYDDAPNVPLNQGDIIGAVDRFGRGLKAAQNTDPNHTPHLLDWGMPDQAAFNPPDQVASGIFVVAADAQTSPAMEKIFFAVQFGETVQVQAT